MTDRFLDVAQSPVPTSAGPCELPILYRDGSLLGLFWRVDPARAAAVVPVPELEPFPLLGGKTLAMLALFEYRDTTVGTYGELGLALHVRRRGTAPSRLLALRDLRPQDEQALLVINLPVTTEAARAAGVELWGYPKYVAGIDTDFRRDGSTRGVLAGELEIEAPRLRGLTLPGLPFVTYSVGLGRLVRTVVETSHPARYGSGRGVALRATGDGPCAATVRALGLEAPPFAAFRVDHLRAVLPAGRDLGPVTTAREPDATAAARPQATA